MKTRQDNDLTYRVDPFYKKKKKKLWIVKTNQTECSLWRKPNKIMIWLIVQMRSKSKPYQTIMTYRIEC